MQRFFLMIVFILVSIAVIGQESKAGKELLVIAYYSGDSRQLDQYPVEKLTHVIYSFCHLKGNRLNVDNSNDSATIKALVAARKRNPYLKVMLSLGGWGGCEHCSPVFASDSNRKEFAKSVKDLCDYFGTDGIDLDWEYPAIVGYPGHPYSKEDRSNFTALIRDLRDTLGAEREISFAAGGFDNFFRESIEWGKVMPLVDRVNLMSYDLVHGFDTVTGHHTPLYSSNKQGFSADYAINYLKELGVPLNKIVIGAAFYARTWANVSDINNGLYQSGKFQSFVPYRLFKEKLTKESGFEFYYDEEAKASYAYNRERKEFATFDDERSIRLKTKYAIAQKLNGIMFWELSLDKATDGLLSVIDEVRSVSH